MQRNGIPSISLQTKTLLNTTLMLEHDLIAHELRRILLIHNGCQLNEHTYAVVFPHFEPCCHRTRRVVEISAVDIHPKAGLVPLLQIYFWQSDTVG